MNAPLDFNYTQEHLTAQAARLGQIFGIEDAGNKIHRDGFLIETVGPNAALITLKMQRYVDVDEALRLLQAVPIEEKPFLTGDRIRVSESATPGELRGAIRAGAIHPDDFDAWLDKNDTILIDATRAKQAAEIRLLIHDLDSTRADGTVLTYGYIQHRLNQMLTEIDRQNADAKARAIGIHTPEPHTDSARRGAEQEGDDAS